jgi:hypothetical membrane protein
MRGVPGWGVLPAVLAPVFLVGGWTLAAALQPPGYDPARETISALAGLAATQRAVMTTALAALGACYLATALALRPAGDAGRLLLAVGGLATGAVAAFPLPRVGSSDVHGLLAGIAFLALALWPAFAARRVSPMTRALRPPACALATLVLLGLLGWFTAELYGEGQRIGLAERVLAAAQALWPLAVVLAARRFDLSPREL